MSRWRSPDRHTRAADWLRMHADGRAQYAAIKRSLASRDGLDVNNYSVDKLPFISEALGRAERWAKKVGWEP